MIAVLPSRQKESPECKGIEPIRRDVWDEDNRNDRCHRWLRRGGSTADIEESAHATDCGARTYRAVGEITVLPLDLARLTNVRAFADAVIERLDGARIDALVLNAGAQFPKVEQRTEDGFEATFAVNHLAHYLLLRLLLPQLAEHARVIITTSDTHDSKTNPIAPPLHADAERLAHPGGGSERRFMAGFRAYSVSKLCNLLRARALTAMPEANAGHFCVIAYNPGFTPGTAPVREWPIPVRVLMTAITFMRPVLRLNTIEQAGDILAQLTLGESTPAGRADLRFAGEASSHLARPL